MSIICYCLYDRCASSLDLSAGRMRLIILMFRSPLLDLNIYDLNIIIIYPAHNVLSSAWHAASLTSAYITCHGFPRDQLLMINPVSVSVTKHNLTCFTIILFSLSILTGFQPHFHNSCTICTYNKTSICPHDCQTLYV